MNLNQGVSVFIPVLNEEDIIEDNLKILINYLNLQEVPYEIIVVNNGSNDKTQTILNEFSKNYPAVKNYYIKKRAVGLALKKGVEVAEFENLVTVDMDLSINLEFISMALNELKNNNIIVGSKITGTQQRSPLRKNASNAFICLARKLLGLYFHDYSIAAKAYKLKCLKKYIAGTNDKTFYVVEVLFMASYDNQPIKEIPVSCCDMRKSRFNLVHEGVHKFGNLFLLWAKFKLKRLKYKKK